MKTRQVDDRIWYHITGFRILNANNTKNKKNCKVISNYGY